MEISSKDLADLDAFVAQDPHINICIEAILQKVVAGQPVVERAGIRQYEEGPLLGARWRDFARQALRHILICGFFAWGTVRRRGKRYPQVLDLGTYSVSVEDSFPKTITIVDAPRGGILMHAFGYDPTKEGEIRGLAARAKKMCMYAKSLRDNSKELDNRRLFPRLFAEMSELKNEIEGVDFDWYAGDGERFERNENEIIDLLQKRKMLVGESDKDGEVTVLPRGQKLVPLPPPNSRTDLVAVLRNIEINIYSMFSVPRHLYAVPSNIRASETAPQYFTDACYQWGVAVEDFLSEVYHGVFSEKIKDLARKGKDIETLKTSVFFEQTSSVPIRELKELYEDGILEWETYAKHALRKAGVRQAVLEPPQVEKEVQKEKKRRIN